MKGVKRVRGRTGDWVEIWHFLVLRRLNGVKWRYTTLKWGSNPYLVLRNAALELFRKGFLPWEKSKKELIPTVRLGLGLTVRYVAVGVGVNSAIRCGWGWGRLCVTVRWGWGEQCVTVRLGLGLTVHLLLGGVVQLYLDVTSPWSDERGVKTAFKSH